MSNRTSLANKAIAHAWLKEQRLVLEGKGTRDWTLEQQQDILNRGKAYGDDGKAFEGHHMKSAEKYPEYQGDLDNIQFLSRNEHFAAHDGNFQNPTNGYYNPITKETSDFGLEKYVPCKIIELSEPIIISMSEQKQNKTSNANVSTTDNIESTKVFISPSPVNTSKKKFIDTSKHFVGETVKFYFRHKSIIDPLMTVTLDKALSLDRKSEISNQNQPIIDGDSASGLDSNITKKGIKERSSPIDHIVSDHGQHYHTKEGLRWHDKESYTRGKNKNE